MPEPGFAAKLKIAKKKPIEHRMNVKRRRGLKVPDSRAGFFFMVISLLMAEQKWKWLHEGWSHRTTPPLLRMSIFLKNCKKKNARINKLHGYAMRSVASLLILRTASRRDRVRRLLFNST